jgi:predicted ATPase/DNA-binding SARP family transcriptional activator
MPGTADLSLALLGPLKVTLGRKPVAGFESDKVRALLVYLVVESERAHRRESLAGLLWPELPERAARHNLSQALFNLRRAIADQIADPPFLLITRETVQFNAASDHWLDTAAFSALLAACDNHQHRQLHTCTACAQRLASAAEIYQGSFLAQFSLADSVAFEEWAVLRREQLQQLGLRALASLAAYHERRGAYEEVSGLALRQLALDPWRESAHRQLMRALALQGDRNAALAQYERCRAVLAAELGVDPEAETLALYERIRDAEQDLAAAEERLALPSSRPHNLPPQLTPFVGRERELALLAGLLAQPGCRLITILGPGGIGKTRLALQAASEQLDAFAHGVFFVPLVGLPTPELLVSAIADALKLALHGAEEPQAQLLAHLRERELLLVCDNFEHLLAGAPLLIELLRHAAGLTILATSRERLNLQAEWLVEVGGMPLPQSESTADIEDSSAVDLFVQSARRVRPDFALATADRPAVTRICQLVEGMPLAIELAAAWLRVLTCAEVAREIEQSLEFLTTALRDIPERHRSLRAVFDHSWDLLSPAEQRVFRGLAVFRGGFRRDAAEHVAGASLPLLAALVDKSLLRKSVAGRYDMHELVRQHAIEKLQQAQELEATQGHYLSFFLELSEAAEQQLAGAAQTLALERLEREHDNLRAALGWAVEHKPEQAARLASALWRFWWMHSHWREGCQWLEQALRHTALPAPARTMLHHAAGVLWHEQGSYAQALAHYEQSLELRRQQGDQRGIASSLNSLGVLALDQGDYRRAAVLFEESIALKRELGDTLGIAGSLNNLGMVVSALEDFPRARDLYQESLVMNRQLGFRSGVATASANLATIALAQGDPIQARLLLGESLALFHELGDKEGIAECLEGLAGVASAPGALQEQPLASARRAARLCAAAEALRQAISAPRIPIERSRYDAVTTAARAQLGTPGFAAAWAEGLAMPIEQAVAYALDSA